VLQTGSKASFPAEALFSRFSGCSARTAWQNQSFFLLAHHEASSNARAKRHEKRSNPFGIDRNHEKIRSSQLNFLKNWSSNFEECRAESKIKTPKDSTRTSSKPSTHCSCPENGRVFTCHFLRE
jgi:hypothetical protein